MAAWRLYVETRDLAASSRLERELRGASAIGLDTDVFVAARRLMPPSARYYWYARRRGAADPPALDRYPLYAGWWLLPRRRTNALADAGWLITYGVDPRSLGVPIGRTEVVEPGFTVAEVRR